MRFFNRFVNGFLAVRPVQTAAIRYRPMKLGEILVRIDQARAGKNLSDAAISRAAGGSDDLLRNWRRQVRDGKTDAGANARTLAAVAKALDISAAWLMTGQDEELAPDPVNTGFAETAAPFSFATTDSGGDPAAALRTLYGGRASSLATYRLAASLPVFNLVESDVLIVDLGRLPEPGDIAIVTIADDNAATTTTVVKRYLPPFLVPGTTENVFAFIKMDKPGVHVRYPVIGVLRGAAGSGAI